jgi:hypothetical protein
MSWRPLLPLEKCTERLELIFPRSAFDAVLSSPLASWAVASLIYVDAVVPAAGQLSVDAKWARPTMVLWLSDEVYARDDASSRAAWYAAANGANAKRAVAELLTSWDLPFHPKYGDNTRETIRDETFPSWLDEGAMRSRAGVKTTSPVPRWALTDDFADLFDPSLQDGALLEKVEAFRESQMSPTGKVKALTARRRSDQLHAVTVKLPDGTQRQLEPGEASQILKGVVEEWAPTRLSDPVILMISEPGDKVYTADADLLDKLGLSIDRSALLPDAVLVDIGVIPVSFWIVEAVASDGPINEARKKALLKWAKRQHIPEESCRFLTAFGSRAAPPAKRRLKDLAVGTFAWYLDEPKRELSWRELP